ncbi:MAG: aspartyl/glutamyl-tRNA amidotransferase subunit A [Candidatus Pacearchaeota archaeon]|nr:aspartyl/glutamyl-tRNA amidotransferase subunit A [Candidatus Pacearchaeota archaeon]
MTTVEKLKGYLKEINKNEKNGNKINAFIFLRSEAELLSEAKKIDEKIKKGEAGVLGGKIFAVKSCINVFGLPVTCASRTLEDYKGTYDATAIKRIRKEDGLIIGMANMDEFASGSSGETSAFGPTNNPVALGRVPGGSSSGSVAAVAANFCDVALGTDTGGSIRNPASHCGVVGLKPSYGLVSRYGLIDLSMSLDQIAPVGKEVMDVALVLSVIAGRDESDPISFESKKIDLEKIKQIPKKMNIGILDIKISDNRIWEGIKEKVEIACKKYGWKSKRISIPFIDLAIETYYPLIYTEFFSGTRKFDGRRYGKKIEDSAGVEVLRRILGGEEITKAEYGGRFYHKSLMIKKMFEKEFLKAFEEVDCIILPSVPRLPHKIGEEISVEDMYGYDSVTIPANLVGNCSVSIPCGRLDNIPYGMQIMCNKLEDEKMLSIAKSFEQLD